MNKLLHFLFSLTLFPLYPRTAYTQQLPEKATHTNRGMVKWETVIDHSFTSYATFQKQWNYLYPWGTDHNGSARMIGDSSNHSNITIQEYGVLKISAQRIAANEGRSISDPHLNIRYHSGAIHAKHQVRVCDSFPACEISGYFKAPVVKGSWPAFWITAVNGWPPESDILEFKGDAINWQNTFITPKNAETIKTTIPDAAVKWHQYKALLTKKDSTNITIDYYIDGKLTGTHQANFMNKPMWIIINLQMEGSSGGPGPETSTDYFIKEVVVKRSRKLGKYR